MTNGPKKTHSSFCFSPCLRDSVVQRFCILRTKEQGAVVNQLNWPELDWEQWKETADTLHMFLQIVGKTRLALTPTQNHWWNVPLYLTARGLTTSVMPLPTGAPLDIEFDFIAHELV